MKLNVIFEWYPSGIGQRRYKNYVAEGDTQDKAIEGIYLLPDFNPEYRVISVEEILAQDGADKHGTIWAETGTAEHAESSTASGLFWRTRTE